MKTNIKHHRKRIRPQAILALAVILVIIVVVLAQIFFAPVWLNRLGERLTHPFTSVVNVKELAVTADTDGDGIDDASDLVDGARLEVKNHTVYRSNYYIGGYPPDSEGVCSDLVWRAFKNAGYDLKSMVDDDIAANSGLYPLTNDKPDPNIDFRRVNDLNVFFPRHAETLTLELKARDADNLALWQRGDIVVTKRGSSWHVAMLSDRRNIDGVPYVIHNAGPFPTEEDCLEKWAANGRIVGHYRWKY